MANIGTSTTGDSIPSRFQYPAMPKGKGGKPSKPARPAAGKPAKPRKK